MKVIEGQTRRVIAEGYLLKKMKDGSIIKTTRTGDQPQPYHAPKVQGRNDLCLCGSGKKFKNCCLNKPVEAPKKHRGRPKKKVTN